LLKTLKNWFNPLTEPRGGGPVVVPESLPEDTAATFNPDVLAIVRDSGLPDTERWQERADREPTEATADLASGVGTTSTNLISPETIAAGYRLHRVIARGGFGEIWEATQEVLLRVVAVKRLRQDLIDANHSNPDRLRYLEAAFRQEALVAAYLEHPNILPVHDLGVDTKGHLLLATKLVRGLPWDVLIDRNKDLPLEEFLDIHLPILESVAKAVAFAAARGIVHRDLKPTQVMVGEFSEVLLMDWGIAMFMHDPPPAPPTFAAAIHKLAPTRIKSSNPAGTVTYMAPEQTEPTTANIGPWTDVYLLGGILFLLLTGRTPHDRESRHKSFFQASMGIVGNPWELAPDRNLPPQLVNVAMSCLQPKPEDRLSSVNEFIRLLHDYRTGASRRREAAELVSRVTSHVTEVTDYKPLTADQGLVARAQTLWPGYAEAERLHELLTVQYARLALRNHDLKLARLQAERLPETHLARQEIVREVTRLETEQSEARQRLDAAYEKAREAHSRADRLVTFLLDDLHTSLREMNRLDLMGKVGREALEYFDSLAEEEPTVASMSKRAVASRNIGDVFRDQGNLEDTGAAFRTFQELSHRLVTLDPAEPQWRALLASSFERLSGLEYLRGNLDESLRLLELGLDLTQQLQLDRTGDFEDEFLYAKLLHQKGIVMWRRRSLEPAFATQKVSLDLFSRLSAEHPDRDDFKQAHGWNLSTMGNVYRDLGNLPEAIRYTQLGLDIRTELTTRDPNNRAYHDEVCWSVTNLALLREYGGDIEGALEAYAEAGRLRRRLVIEDPTNAGHRNKLTFILSSKGRNLYGMGRYEEACAITAESCEISRAIANADPSNVHEVGSHALNLGYRGLALFHAGRIKEAREVLAESQPAAVRAVSAVPENGVFQNARCQAYILEGNLANLDGNPVAARAAWSAAMEILDKQSWRRSTGQGAGMHLELSILLGNIEDARADAEILVKNSWMMPRCAELLATLK
jgi:serine/threonine protein kinase/tetratricopeptide (TPR) repeat protein